MIESETLDEVALIGSRLILSSDQIFILYRYGSEEFISMSSRMEIILQT